VIDRKDAVIAMPVFSRRRNEIRSLRRACRRRTRSVSAAKPASPAALVRCKGIGEKRLADFGGALLDMVAGREPSAGE